MSRVAGISRAPNGHAWAAPRAAEAKASKLGLSFGR